MPYAIKNRDEIVASLRTTIIAPMLAANAEAELAERKSKLVVALTSPQAIEGAASLIGEDVNQMDSAEAHMAINGLLIDALSAPKAAKTAGEKAFAQVVTNKNKSGANGASLLASMEAVRKAAKALGVSLEIANKAACPIGKSGRYVKAAETPKPYQQVWAKAVAAQKIQALRATTKPTPSAAA